MRKAQSLPDCHAVCVGHQARGSWASNSHSKGWQARPGGGRVDFAPLLCCRHAHQSAPRRAPGGQRVRCGARRAGQRHGPGGGGRRPSLSWGLINRNGRGGPRSSRRCRGQRACPAARRACVAAARPHFFKGKADAPLQGLSRGRRWGALRRGHNAAAAGRGGSAGAGGVVGAKARQKHLFACVQGVEGGCRL
jgi:hypothetical protein